MATETTRRRRRLLCRALVFVVSAASVGAAVSREATQAAHLGDRFEISLRSTESERVERSLGGLSFLVAAVRDHVPQRDVLIVGATDTEANRGLILRLCAYFWPRLTGIMTGPATKEMIASGLDAAREQGLAVWFLALDTDHGIEAASSSELVWAAHGARLLRLR